MAQQVLDRLAAQGVSAASLCGDSRMVEPGDIFLAYPGARADGRRFITAAVDKGAAAVLWERSDRDQDAVIAVANLAVEGLHGLAGYLAHLVYGRPSEKLWMVGITGTNGKTSISQWIARSLAGLGRPCAVIGTLGGGFPGALTAGLNTTPDAIELHRSLARLRAQGAEAAALEVSSIGLDQGRVNGIAFDVAVFTNLTRDHLEYHGTMEAYAAAKAKLFELSGLKHAVFNLDDAFGRELAGRLRGTAVERIGYTLEPMFSGADVDALIAARDIAATAGGLRFTALTPQGAARVEAPLAGRFNVSNLLAVLATLLASGETLDQAVSQLARLTPPPGRMQMQGGTDEPLVIVDYAHTPDALEQALTALRDTARARGGRLTCLFGCGGERDPGKRPLMGEVAARHADKVIVTSDNPRGEDPGAIIGAIVHGAGSAAVVIEDRARAIAQAVLDADAADVLLIAGKGHETYQEVAGQRLPFSDSEQAALALAQRGSRTP
jgi:UDP-N-acetylmuramoyl-L-alanyl-D-glutamate--2,6-diaminopimelate ligase